MNHSHKSRLDKPDPKLHSPDFDVGVLATRLMSYTRKVTSTCSGFTKLCKYNGDIADAMDTARTIMKTAYMANEMPKYSPYIERRTMLIREAIGECAYFENMVYSFWEAGFISGEVWDEWCRKIGSVKAKSINWFNSLNAKR